MFTYVHSPHHEVRLYVVKTANTNDRQTDRQTDKQTLIMLPLIKIVIRNLTYIWTH